MTGEVYKMELDGTVLGRFGKAGHGAQGVQQHPPDGLPEPGRNLRRRDHRVARAEDHPAPAAVRSSGGQVGGHHETYLQRSCLAAALCACRRVASSRSRLPTSNYDANADFLIDAGEHLPR